MHRVSGCLSEPRHSANLVFFVWSKQALVKIAFQSAWMISIEYVRIRECFQLQHCSVCHWKASKCLRKDLFEADGKAHTSPSCQSLEKATRINAINKNSNGVNRTFHEFWGI